MPKTVFGIVAYNHAAEARETIESILGQTDKDFAVVVVDDGSTDGTAEILEEYAVPGSRVHLLRNDRRVGMIENWRRAFELARTRHPEARYFAWGSDHDLWHPRWLSVLSAILDERADVVLAYPLNTKIRPDGSTVDRKPWHFDTADVASPISRVWRTSWRMSAGNMVYGLFRADALVRAGVFRRVLVPDRLLLAELSACGRFRQADQILWFRRWYGRIFSVGRQRESFFPDGTPLYAYLPWSVSHAAVFAWNVVFRRTARGAPGFWTACGAAMLHAAAVLSLNVVQSLRTLWPRGGRDS